MTTTQKQWTMYRVYTLPRRIHEKTYKLKIPFKYVLIHHNLREYIPLEEGEA